MRRVLLQIIAGIAGLYIASQFVPNVEFQNPWPQIIWAGGVLGMLNFLAKPVLNIITFPLRILTFGAVSLLVNMLFVWAVDILFIDLIIPGFIPLLLVTLVVWAVSFLLNLIL